MKIIQVDVIIPTVRPHSVQKVIYSLSKNTVKPDMVSIVSNEIQREHVSCYGLKVRCVHFSSSYYPVGSYDVVLRRNVGIWSSSCSHIITFDDDQIAPINMVQKSIELLRARPYFWGNYRFIDFSKYYIDEIIQLSPEKGRSREHPANTYHSWMSCYGGLLGIKKQLIEELGGFDMVYCGRHAGEDQNLGKRLAHVIDQSDRVFIYEPPFAWHPEEKISWIMNYSNLCPSKHQLSQFSYKGLIIEKCAICPYFKILNGKINRKDIIMKFEPEKVKITSEII